MTITIDFLSVGIGIGIGVCGVAGFLAWVAVAGASR
jgi:hypothetical protein